MYTLEIRVKFLGILIFVDFLSYKNTKNICCLFLQSKGQIYRDIPPILSLLHLGVYSTYHSMYMYSELRVSIPA